MKYQVGPFLGGLHSTEFNTREDAIAYATHRAMADKRDYRVYGFTKVATVEYVLAESTRLSEYRGGG